MEFLIHFYLTQNLNTFTIFVNFLPSNRCLFKEISFSAYFLIISFYVKSFYLNPKPLLSLYPLLTAFKITFYAYFEFLNPNSFYFFFLLYESSHKASSIKSPGIS